MSEPEQDELFPTEHKPEEGNITITNPGREDSHLNGYWGDEPPDDPWPEEEPPPSAARVESSEDDGAGDGRPPSAAAQLANIALESYRFGVTEQGEAFGVPNNGHVVQLLRGSRASLRAELAKEYRRRTGKIAPQQALADALLALEGEAQEAEPERVYLRVAEYEGAVWIDLGDAAATVVVVRAEGWTVASASPILFRRSALTGAMPVPERGGDWGELWELLNVAEEDRPLVKGWLVAALGAPEIPHPALALFGEQGTGKSTASRLLIDVVDPSAVPLRKPPKDQESWVTAAAGSWVVGLDNLSTVPDWFSDSLSRAVTGDGDVRRALYTDGGLSVFSFRRVLLLNGIDLGGLLGDLTERLLVVELRTIPDGERRTESELNTAWRAARPRILGLLLDAVAGMAGVLPSVRLDTSPRMADFARVLAALDEGGLGRYMEQSRTMAADSLAGQPFIVAMMDNLPAQFEGTAAELRAAVTPSENGRLVPPRGWPTARAVTGLLKRNAPALRKQGWQVDDLGSHNKDKVTRWAVSRPEKAGKRPPPPPPDPPSAGLAGQAGIAGQGSRPSQDEQPPPQPDRESGRCPDCGEDLAGPGLLNRCRPNHTAT
jgi:hypothetical protein